MPACENGFEIISILLTSTLFFFRMPACEITPKLRIRPILACRHVKFPRNCKSANKTHSRSRIAPMTTGSDPLRRSVSIQVGWMERGYVRNEIFEECRRESDGADDSESELPQDFRAKKRKLQADVDFRDSISRSILKHIYQNIHTFFRKGREAAKKQFLQELGYVRRPEAEAVVSFRDTTDDLSSDVVPFAALSNVEMAYPRSLNDIRNDDENERLYAELLSTHLYLQAYATYSVSVKGKHGREEK
jgi:hypothetical protein